MMLFGRDIETYPSHTLEIGGSKYIMELNYIGC
jgi:hypothetical protein